MSESNRERLFDDWAEKYDNSIRSSDKYPFAGYENVLNRIVVLSNPKPNMNILDLGVGTGNLSEKFVNYDVTVWGIDFSNEMLKKAGEKLPDVILGQANLLDEWPSDFDLKYDRVVSAYLFHEFNLTDKIKLIHKIKNDYLAENGKIIIGDIAFPNDPALNKVREFSPDWDEREFYWLVDETINAFENEGIKINFEQISICAGIFVLE